MVLTNRYALDGVAAPSSLRPEWSGCRQRPAPSRLLLIQWKPSTYLVGSAAWTFGGHLPAGHLSETRQSRVFYRRTLGRDPGVSGVSATRVSTRGS